MTPCLSTGGSTGASRVQARTAAMPSSVIRYTRLPRVPDSGTTVRDAAYPAFSSRLSSP